MGPPLASTRFEPTEKTLSHGKRDRAGCVPTRRWPSSEHEHGVAEGIEAVALGDRGAVELARLLDADERHDEREQRRARKVEVRQQCVDAPELEAGSDEERRPSRQLTGADDGLERANRRRPDRENALRRLDPRPLAGLDLVALAVQAMVFERLARDRTERVEPDVKRDPRRIEPSEKVGGQVESGRRCGGRAEGARVYGLIPLRVGERLVDVRRKWHLALGLAFESQQPATVAERLEELHRPQALAGAQPPRRPRESLPAPPCIDLLEKQDLHHSAGRT